MRRPKGYGKAWLLVESPWVKRVELEKDIAAAPDETDQDDMGASGTSWVALREHTAGVAEKALNLATLCGLNGGTATTLEIAARRHDQGKQDERFQYMLSPEMPDEPLAKNRVERAEWKRRQEDAGFPKGARHEFASVKLAEKLGAWPEGCDAELALHLIGTHHGYGRPFPPVWDDRDYVIRARIDGQALAVPKVHQIARVDSGWVDQYWSLTRKYGWWGLAYLEAILRRADCLQSRKDQEEG